MLTIGLVAEGAHDFIMLEPFIRREVRRRTGREIRFRKLQPAPDQTGTMADGGWSRVIAWCKLYAGDAIETFFTPVFAGDVPCDVIIVHLDGDALEEVRAHTTVIIPSPVPSIEVRLCVLTEVLEECLAASPDSRRRIALALPVLQTEAWMLAAEGDSGRVEGIDAKREFRRSYRQHSGGMAKKYTSRVRNIGANPNAEVCISYQRFVSEVNNLVIV